MSDQAQPGRVRWDEVRALELSLLAAWPATDRLVRRGWVFTANGGHTARANTAVAVDPAADHRILDEIETWYGARAQTPMLRTTPLTPGATIAEARARGYVDRPGSCHVMVRAQLDPAEPTLAVELAATPTDRWWSLTDRSGPQRRVLTRMFRVFGDDCVFAAIADADGPVAIGQGVVARRHLHIFAMHTLATHRGCGFATAIMQRLEAWGADRGAEIATLQVTVDNAGALSLYHRRRYRTAYRYDYLAHASA